MLVVMMVIRKLLDFLFTQRELKILDDVMPESSRRKDEEERIINDFDEPAPGEAKRKFSTVPGTEGLAVGESGNLQIALANGNVMKIPLSSVNITEEVNKTGIWKQVNTINTKESPVKEKPSNCVNNDRSNKDKGARKRGNKKDALSEEERRRLSTMNEEEEEDGLTIKVDPVV
jgi:sodium bicarbonate transporter 10